MTLNIKRIHAGETVPVQLNGNNEFILTKLDENGYRIHFSTVSLVVTDSQLKEARDKMKREREEKISEAKIELKKAQAKLLEVSRR